MIGFGWRETRKEEEETRGKNDAPHKNHPIYIYIFTAFLSFRNDGFNNAYNIVLQVFSYKRVPFRFYIYFSFLLHAFMWYTIIVN